jgi:hypothetical protein
MKKTLVILLAASMMAAFATSASAEVAVGQTWNDVSDFSITNGNPNGAWSYGYYATSSDFQLYNYCYSFYKGDRWDSTGTGSEPLVWKNTSTSSGWGVAPGELSLHPGSSGQASIVRWTAGFTGAVTVIGQFLAGDSGTMQVAIVDNGNWDSKLWSATDCGTFNLTLSVTEGETIDFAAYGGYISGNTPLDVTITAVPEPSTIALFGIGVAGMIGFARYRRRKG